jgi:hypothetical protein
MLKFFDLTGDVAVMACCSEVALRERLVACVTRYGADVCAGLTRSEIGGDAGTLALTNRNNTREY